MATDLAAWLLEQIAEDERAAKAAPDDPSAELTTWIEYYSNPEVELAQAYIDQHKPSRVLAECEAKRRIIELHGPTPGQDFTYPEAAKLCATCGPGDDWRAQEEWATGQLPCNTLRLLALPYADRPGYLEAWRPSDEKPPPSRGQGNWTT